MSERQGHSTVRLADKLNMETSTIAWRELQTFFAKGAVLMVAAELDLLQVAEQLVADNTDLVEQWMADNKLAKVTDQQASEWIAADAVVWAVVIKPWVLVQTTNA
ncbi:MAG: DUF2288 domain-containing protein [Pseudomonadales bacterium]